MDIRMTFTGTTPLLMHSDVTVNALNPLTKAIKKVTSKKTGKTDEDHEEIARLEHLAGLYFAEGIGPYMPGRNVEACLIKAGGITRMGTKLKQALFVSTDTNPLAYTGPRDIKALWADENFRYMSSVKVGQARTMRCRPQFREWKFECEAILDTSVIDLADLTDIADTAGQRIGLGDFRPRFGRFTATVEQATG